MGPVARSWIALVSFLALPVFGCDRPRARAEPAPGEAVAVAKSDELGGGAASSTQAPGSPHTNEAPPDDSPTAAPRPPSAIAVPSSAEIAKRARAVLAAQEKIAKIGSLDVSRGDSYDIELGPGGPAGLRAAKDTLVAMVEAVLDELGPAALSHTDEELAAALGGAFEVAGVSVSDGSGELGRIGYLAVRRITGHSGMVGVTLTLSSPVGSDDLTCLLRAEGGGFSRVMELRNDDYRSVRGGRFASLYAVTPPAADGSWFVVDAHSHAWIASLWRGIDVRVFDPTTRPDRPKKVLEQQDDAWLGDEVFATIEPRAGGFALRYTSWDQLGGRVTRSYVRSYDRKGASFERVGPFVAHPRDLLDELSSIAPRDAAKLGVAGSEASLRGARAALDARPSSYGDFMIAGSSEWTPAEQLGDAVDVAFTCPECQGFPRTVEYKAKKTSDHGWLIESIRVTP